MPGSELFDVPMVDIRPLLPSKQEGDKTREYPHQVTALDTVTVTQIPIPRGVRYVLMQARNQDINYVISGRESNPSQTSGFILYAGNDPLAVPMLGGAGQQISVIASAAGAVLEHQFCQ